MWSFLSSFLSQIITSLIAQFSITKKIETNVIQKEVIKYSKAPLTTINTFSSQDLIKKYDKVNTA